MAKKIINIRLEESVWKQAKRDAVDHDMTLQDWITFLILRGDSHPGDDTGIIHVDYDKRRTRIYDKDGNIKVSA